MTNSPIKINLKFEKKNQHTPLLNLTYPNTNPTCPVQLPPLSIAFQAHNKTIEEADVQGGKSKRTEKKT
jgi:hypothetical protein